MFKKTVIGLDIADHTIEVAELSGLGLRTNILNLGRIRLSEGVVDHGHIKEPEGVDFLIESKPLTNKEKKEISELIKTLKKKKSIRETRTTRRKKVAEST